MTIFHFNFDLSSKGFSMNAVANSLPVITQIRRADLPIPGAPLGGGFFANIYRNGEEARALIVAPKADGERKRVIWAPNLEMLSGALSFTDGLANTKAMAAAGSKLAADFLSLRIGDADDWHLPALDQQEILYRTFKPTADKNYCVSGCNINALPPTQRYLPDSPAQTGLELFREGGVEAYEADDYYWCSNQYAGSPDCAWGADFDGGNQYNYRKDYSARARAVRSILVI
jgi:hypothetical protein